MADPSASTHPRRTRKSVPTLPACFVLLLMAGEWILFVAGTRFHEMLVGLAGVLLSAAFVRTIYIDSEFRIELRARDLLQAWRIPSYIVADCWAISVILFQDLFTSRKAESLFRVCGFVTAKDDPLLVGRRVLATIYTSATPSIIVLGVDYAQSRLLFHQLRRAPLPTMTQNLGART